MSNYEETRVKLTNTQLNKLKSAAKISLDNIKKTKKNFQNEELPIISNNKTKNLKISLLATCRQIAQLSKIIQSGRFICALIGKLVSPLIKVGVPFVKTFWHH